MFKKPALLTAFGIGYVLGARAGRERYDAIAGKAQELWHDPRVQEKAERARLLAKEQADMAKERVKTKMHVGAGPASPTSGSTTSTSPPASDAVPGTELFADQVP